MVAKNNWNTGLEVPLEAQISFKGLKSHFRRCECHIVCKINCNYKTGMAHLNQTLTSPHLLSCVCPKLIHAEVRNLLCAKLLWTKLLLVKFNSVNQL